MSRKTAREVVMKLSFARLFGGEDTYDAILEKSGINEKPTEDDLTFSDTILRGMEENHDVIDSLISDAAIGWTIERMSKVDLSIMRIAVYEMKFRTDIPCSVSINEAVELAKKFSGDNAGAFINGTLGTIAKRIESEG